MMWALAAQAARPAATTRGLLRPRIYRTPISASPDASSRTTALAARAEEVARQSRSASRPSRTTRRRRRPSVPARRHAGGRPAVGMAGPGRAGVRRNPRAQEQVLDVGDDDTRDARGPKSWNKFDARLAALAAATAGDRPRPPDDPMRPFDTVIAASIAATPTQPEKPAPVDKAMSAFDAKVAAMLAEANSSGPATAASAGVIEAEKKPAAVRRREAELRAPAGPVARTVRRSRPRRPDLARRRGSAADESAAASDAGTADLAQPAQCRGRAAAGPTRTSAAPRRCRA